MTNEIHITSILLGTSFQFSDQLIRVLSFEFPEVQFERQHDVSSLSKVFPKPQLLIVHEALPDLDMSIRNIRTCLPEAMIAVACADTAAFCGVLKHETARSVSLLTFNTPIDVWLSVLRLLLCGHAYVPAEALSGPREAAPSRTPCAAVRKPDVRARLTEREKQILPLIAQGLQNKVIAASLGLSEHTVKLHTHNIFSKLGVSNRTGAASWYLSQVTATEPSGRPDGK